MTTSTLTEGARSANKPMQLARYTVSAGERVIYGQRILGVVRF